MPPASAIVAISRARTIPPDFMILMLTRSAISPRTMSRASVGVNTLSSAMMGVSRLGDCGHSSTLLALDRLLDEGRAKGFDVLEVADRIPRIESLIVVDPQIDGRREVCPEPFETSQVFLVGGKARLHLEDVDAVGDQRLRKVAIFLEIRIGDRHAERHFAAVIAA